MTSPQFSISTRTVRDKRRSYDGSRLLALCTKQFRFQLDGGKYSRLLLRKGFQRTFCRHLPDHHPPQFWI
ncbi:hypothetical protein NQZ68_040857 [Dissostichus eleginoides]|nr:hypothetical protein NQZ68_040857 [Dissostichus eleginoides]